MAVKNDLNKVTLIGRLVRDVEVKTLPKGTEVANFSIACNYGIKRGNEWEEAVSYFDIQAFWGFKGIVDYLVKGKQVAIDGELRQNRWETDDGQKRSRVIVNAHRIQLLGGGESNGNGVSYTPNETLAEKDDFQSEFPDAIPF